MPGGIRWEGRRGHCPRLPDGHSSNKSASKKPAQSNAGELCRPRQTQTTVPARSWTFVSTVYLTAGVVFQLFANSNRASALRQALRHLFKSIESILRPEALIVEVGGRAARCAGLGNFGGRDSRGSGAQPKGVWVAPSRKGWLASKKSEPGPLLEALAIVRGHAPGEPGLIRPCRLRR